MWRVPGKLDYRLRDVDDDAQLPHATLEVILSSSRPRLNLFARCRDVHAICAGILAHQRLVDFVRVDLDGRLTGVFREGTVRLSRGGTGHIAACANRRDTVYFNTNITECDIHWCAVVDARWRRLLSPGSCVFFQ